MTWTTSNQGTANWDSATGSAGWNSASGSSRWGGTQYSGMTWIEATFSWNEIQGLTFSDLQ